MAFTHSPMPKHPSLVASYCKKCKEFVAASPEPKILKSAEQVHKCPHNGRAQIKKPAKPAN